MRYLNRVKIILLFVIFSFLFAFIAGCSAGAESSQDELKMATLDGMPAEVKAAPVVVRQAYQFAVSNPDVLKQIPCYCGCGAIGHTSNYSCYVSGVDANGVVNFDNHALGCSICVDITQDAMRMIEHGKSVPEIKTYIDQNYSQYGSSNLP